MSLPKSSYFSHLPTIQQRNTGTYSYTSPKSEVALYINDKAIGSGEIGKTVPFGWSLSGEGLCCCCDSETPVSERYSSPFKFTGQIDRVLVSVSGQPFSHVAKEVENAFIAQ
jgi:hypothetical protein